MKRISGVVLALLFSFALEAQETSRYLVATEGALRPGRARDLVMRAGVEPEGDIATFRSFRGFAADLTADEAARLRRSDGIRWVTPVVERYALETRNLAGQTTPYGIGLINAAAAWKGTTSGDVNVAVLDTGVDFEHPDLAPLFAGGYNAIVSSASHKDDNGHGTHVAGIVTAADNDIGVVGVAGPSNRVRLWGVKVLSANGKGTDEAIIRAIDWVVQKKQQTGGRWIINMSLGAPVGSNAEEEALKRASNAGVLVIAAAGNESTPELPAPVLYPAAYETVLAVGAVNAASAIANFSNQGPELDVVAPGVSVLSTVPVGTGAISSVDSAAGLMNAYALTGSKKGRVTAEYVYCGLGAEADFPQSVNGRIALIRRGGDTFANKTRRAMQRGAIAVVIFNNELSDISWTLINLAEPTGTDWPVTVGISQAEGEALAGENFGTMTISYIEDSYKEMSGTSMAAPYAAGAAALLWALAPSATAADIAAVMRSTARDLGGAGVDSVFGAGLIDLGAASRELAPSAFQPDAPPQSSRPTTGRTVLRRGGRG